MKPDYDQWAEALIQDIYYSPEDKRVDIVKHHLLKAVQRGYTEGIESGWWKEQEKQRCSYNGVCSLAKPKEV